MERAPKPMTAPAASPMGNIARPRKKSRAGPSPPRDRRSSPRFAGEVLGESLPRQRGGEGAPGGRRIAEAEAPRSLGIDAAVGEVARSGGLAGEGALEPAGGEFEDLMQPLAPALRGARFRRAFGKREARLGGERRHGFRKRQPLVAHDEADDVAMGAAAEAVEKPLVVVHREGGGFLVVEGAEADMLAAAPREADAASRPFAHRQAGADVVEEARRESHAPPARRVFTMRLAAAKSIRPA